MNREAIGACVVHFPLKKKRERENKKERGGKKAQIGREPLVVRCRSPFVKHMSNLQSQQRRGEWENYSCKEKNKGGRRWVGRQETRRRGIDLTLGESHHSSVHFHSSGLVMWVLIWQVGGRGQEGDLGGWGNFIRIQSLLSFTSHTSVRHMRCCRCMLHIRAHANPLVPR